MRHPPFHNESRWRLSLNIVEFLYSQSISIFADQNSARTIASVQLPVQTTTHHIEASSDSVSRNRTFKGALGLNIWFKIQCCELEQPKAGSSTKDILKLTGRTSSESTGFDRSCDRMVRYRPNRPYARDTTIIIGTVRTTRNEIEM